MHTKEIGLSEGPAIVTKVRGEISRMRKTHLLAFFRPPFVRVSRRLLDFRLLLAMGSGEDEPKARCVLDGDMVVVRGDVILSSKAFPNLYSVIKVKLD